MEINIPFREEFREAMLNNTKTCTSRTRQYGKVGDMFSAFGCQFQITKVERRTLRDVRDMLWKQEGLTSPDEFVEVWKKLHKVRGFDPWQRVYVHHFKKIGEPPKEHLIAYA